MYKKVELDEGTPVQYVGMYILRWKPEWGKPEVGFVEADVDHEFLNNPEIRHLLCEVEQLKAEIDIDNALLGSYERLMDEIPECPIHGNRCILHAKSWIMAAAKEFPCDNRQ